MKKFVVLLIFTLLASSAWAVDIHVSNKGSDETGTGAKSAPVASVEKARDLARSVHEKSPEEVANIWIHEGDYYLARPVTFTEKDFNLEIAAWESDQPRFYGGKPVEGWKKSAFGGRTDVFEADLKAVGGTVPVPKVHQLFYRGSRQIWARYPNFDPRYPYAGGWAYVEGEVFGMYQDVPGERCDWVALKSDDFRNWARPDEGEICIFPRYNWWNRVEKIREVDAEKRALILERPMQYAARPRDRYCVMGFREELDAPGEWYQDVENQKLYFIPPKDATFPDSSECSGVAIPMAGSVLEFRKSKNVVIRGLDLCGSETNGVMIVDSENVTLEKCSLHDLGFFSGAAVNVSNGKNCTVRGCDIWNIGGHGVEVHGGNAKTMEKLGHNIENNYIHHVGQMNRHGIGVMMHCQGVRIAHNLIHDTPRCAIYYGGNLNLIEYNVMRHVNLEMEDTAAVYGGGWTGGNSVIRYNHVSDSIGFGHRMGKYQFYMFAWGIYIDEAGGGVDVYGNLVERCQVGAMHLHNGRESHIFNNIFVNNAGREGKTHQISFQGWNNDPNGYFVARRQKNIMKEYDAKISANPDWAQLRGFRTSPADPFLPDGTVMQGNRLERNIFYYPDQPESRYAKVVNCTFEYNPFDNNLLWAGENVDIRTGRSGTKAEGRAISDVVPNREFAKGVSEEELAKNPNATAAEGWTWYCKSRSDARSEWVTNAENQHALRIYEAYNPQQKYTQHACVRSLPFTLEPGKDYRLRYRVRICDAPAGTVSVRFVTEGNGLWRAFGDANSGKLPAGTDSKLCESVFHFPLPGEPNYDERIGRLTLQFTFASDAGYAEISEIQLDEVQIATEWEAWQQAGADAHSVVADPQFLDPAHGDYRLRETSPALRLGFTPLPLDRMGPFAAPYRATWPIHEAPGARENPQWLEVPEEKQEEK